MHLPFDLSSINISNISLVGWLLIGAAVIVLGGALLRLFGHLLHILIKGCGVVLLALAAFYVLRLLGIL